MTAPHACVRKKRVMSRGRNTCVYPEPARMNHLSLISSAVLREDATVTVLCDF